MASALVIDDSRSTADTLCLMLSALGVRARAAYGPRAALLMLSEALPDIIFLDINMPGVDGFEVLAYLRREPRLAKIPVVVVTSDDQPETANKARRTGALLTIIKPATLDAIEGIVKKAGLI
jgi:CheY-like chemotaxis protein